MLNTLFCLGNPPIDPASGKALRLPIFNPISRHGRVFFFAWLSFLLSFLSWYSTVALMPETIKKDINLTDNETKNAAIIGGVASLLVRLIAGEMCERFGPRYVLVATLWISAIPCGAAGTASDALGFYFVKFFMGISGAAIVPAQCLIAQWFGQRVIGTASAFAAGWGDAGVGVTFFVMPAVFNSLVGLHSMSVRVAWRISFLVPCILLLAVGLAVLLLNDDTPTGPWSERQKNQPRRESVEPVLDRTANSSMTVFGPERPAAAVVKGGETDLEKNEDMTAQVTRRGSEATDVSPAPAPPKQSFGSQMKDLFCMPTLMLSATYFATFGASLSVNSSLLSWYMAKFGWSQTYAANWAAFFGLLNIFSRPLGGVIADILYRRFGQAEGRGLVAKKYWMAALAVVGGVLGLLVGLISPNTPTGLVALVSIFAIFIEAGNGATYALLPAVNPHINGLMGGVVGASGNLGGVVFSSVARYRSIPTTVATAGVVCIVTGLIIPFINHAPRNKRSLYKASTAATTFNRSFS